MWCLHYLATSELLGKDPLHSCLFSLDLVLIVDMAIYSMGNLETILPLVGPKNHFDICLMQDYVLISYKYFLEAMITFGIPSGDISFILSKDHLPRLDCCEIKSRLDFH